MRDKSGQGMTAVHILVFDGMADWEPGHALAELRRWGKRDVVAVGFDRTPIRTMGGLAIVPDTTLGEVSAGSVELLILPGGDMWEGGAYPRGRLEQLVRDLLDAGKPVAAICGATLGVGRAGVLDDRKHTSTIRADLTQHVPEYRGQSNYMEAPAVRDRHLITATGLAPVDFAREIFAELGIFSPSDEQVWFDMYKHGRLPEASR